MRVFSCVRSSVVLSVRIIANQPHCRVATVAAALPINIHTAGHIPAGANEQERARERGRTPQKRRQPAAF